MNVNVESVALQAAKGGCGICIHELKQASTELKSAYQDAGTGWRDKQYVRLGAIVDECCEALEKPIEQLKKCVEALDNMISLIEAYEDEDL